MTQDGGTLAGLSKEEADRISASLDRQNWNVEIVNESSGKFKLRITPRLPPQQQQQQQQRQERQQQVYRSGDDEP